MVLVKRKPREVGAPGGGDRLSPGRTYGPVKGGKSDEKPWLHIHVPERSTLGDLAHSAEKPDVRVPCKVLIEKERPFIRTPS